MSPVRLCAMAGCPGLAEVRGRCTEHAAVERKGNRSPNDSWYSSKPWRMSRRKQLHDHPLCQYQLEDGTTCGVVADSVHHRTPIEDGGARRDPQNLMSLCRPHHSAIHRLRGEGAAGERDDALRRWAARCKEQRYSHWKTGQVALKNGRA